MSDGKPDAGVNTDCDVLIAGAGLVGLALAPALAASGLAVALSDRAPVAAPREPAEGDDWDTRVYAISPGSAAFLRALGAWQALPAERLAAIESMRVVGDDGGMLDFDAYDLGERALAWIVEERALRAALVPLVRAAGVAIHAPRAIAAIAWSADRGEVRFDDGGGVTARLVVGADGLRSWVREAAGIVATPRAVRADGRRRQFRVRTRAPRACAPVVPRRRRHPRVAAAAGASHLDRLVGARCARARAAGARSERARGARRGRRPGRARRARLHHAGGGLSAAALEAAGGRRASSRARRRRRARRPSAGGPGREPGLRRRRGAGRRAARARPGRRCRSADPARTLRAPARRTGRAMQTVTDGLARLFRIRAPVVRSVRNLGLAAVDRMPLAQRLLAQSALR